MYNILMKLIYPLYQITNPLSPLRRAGYQFFIDPRTKKESFVLKTSTEFYPRFHLYLNYEGENIEFDLHLDQKKPQYKGAKAHNAEYDGPTVLREMLRLRGWIANEFQVLPINDSDYNVNSRQSNEITSPISKNDSDDPKPAKKLFGGIF
jgi:hypothetical protein